MKKFLVFLTIAIYSHTSEANNDLARSFIKIFNAGSRLEVIDYLSKNMSKDRIERYGIDAHVGVFLNNQNTFGKLELVELLPTQNNNDRMVVISKNNQLTYTQTT